MKSFLFTSLAVTGEGISGGDRIFIELARNWSLKDKIKIYTSFQGSRLIKKQKLFSKNVSVETIPNKRFSQIFLLDYIFKVFYSLYLGLATDLKITNYVYSSSEFLMDVLPAFIFKIRNKNIKWIATWYQTAPNPLKGFAESDRENKYNLKALLYWLSQLPTKPLISNFSECILVNNVSEKKVFPNNKTIVLIGAVPMENINLFRKKNKNISKKYEAIFQGRFHAQKGVVELIEIWREVVNKMPDAKLAMIGDGPLMNDVKAKIIELSLEKNIELLGYLFDGGKKFKIFSQSKIVVHPAYYDSGGMAAAEAMAFGLPAIGFNLESYKSYYPKGMLKVKQNDLGSFASTILKLLDEKNVYKKYSKEAQKLIENKYSWERRAEEIYKKVVL